jgi:hypothetical protein
LGKWHQDLTNLSCYFEFPNLVIYRFPPSLWVDLSEMWNNSKTPYLVCYHPPRDIIECYEFDVELVTQMTTSMHGSKEGHMGYIYRRKPMTKQVLGACDPAFSKATQEVNKGLDSLKEHVDTTVGKFMSSGPSTRASRRRGASSK